MDCLGRVRLFIPGMLARKLAYVQVQGEEGQGNPKLFISSVVVGSAHLKYLFFAYYPTVNKVIVASLKEFDQSPFLILLINYKNFLNIKVKLSGFRRKKARSAVL
jgi:hypothetical protein